MTKTRDIDKPFLTQREPSEIKITNENEELFGAPQKHRNS